MIAAWTFWLNVWIDLIEMAILVPSQPSPLKSPCLGSSELDRKVIDLDRWRTDHPPDRPKGPTDKRAA
jgi:hypothetical protein